MNKDASQGPESICDHPPGEWKFQIEGEFKHEGGELIDNQHIVIVCLKCGRIILDECESQDDEIPY